MDVVPTRTRKEESVGLTWNGEEISRPFRVTVEEWGKIEPLLSDKHILAGVGKILAAEAKLRNGHSERVQTHLKAEIDQHLCVIRSRMARLRR